MPCAASSGNLGPDNLGVRAELGLALSRWQPGRHAAPVQQIAHAPVVRRPAVTALPHVVGAQRVAASDHDTAQRAEAHRYKPEAILHLVTATCATTSTWRRVGEVLEVGSTVTHLRRHQSSYPFVIS